MTQKNTPPTGPSPDEPDNLVLQARDVHFDWSATPMHWVPNEPVASHVFNMMHLLLPAGENWFVEMFKEALPLIKDEKLREDVLGFIGQEAVHAHSHSDALGHLREQGIDPTPYLRQLEWIFQHVLGDRGLTGKAREEWLIERLAIIAAVEHLTGFFGQWILDARALDEAGADPTMLDLLRWHGAEEVEHRSVAFDLYQHLDGRYTRRMRTTVAVPFLTWMWFRGLRFLLANDPQLKGRRRLPWWLGYHRAGKRGLVPTYGEMLRCIAHYVQRSYDPSREGSTSQAVAYLATSPAAQAADRATA